MPRWIFGLFIFTILTPILEAFEGPPILIFVMAALGIIPLAALLGQALEHVVEHTGEYIGGLLFATFGNATELIIGILLLTRGLVDVVRASIIGSVLANVLLMLGISICVGGFKHGRLRFQTRIAGEYASLFFLCMGGLVLPAFAELLASRLHQDAIVERGVMLSTFLAVVLLMGYLASILFSVFRVGDKGPEVEPDPVLGVHSEASIKRMLNSRHRYAHHSPSLKRDMQQQIDHALKIFIESQEAELQENAKRNIFQRTFKPSLWTSIFLVAGATAGVAYLSEILVGKITPLADILHWNPTFVGLVFLPLIGGIPDYIHTTLMAIDKRIGMVLAASAGSSIQITLFVAPILVLVSHFTAKPLDLVFNLIELAVLGLAILLFNEITKDGELAWLEGLLLLLIYVMMGGTVFVFGG